jgi:hypothetical protein
VSAKPGQHHLFEYIKAFYNDNRRHSSLEFASPVQYGKTGSKPSERTMKNRVALSYQVR